MIYKITKIVNQRFSKTLVLIRSRVKHNRRSITQTSDLILPPYLKPRILLNLGLNFFVIQANDTKEI